MKTLRNNIYILYFDSGCRPYWIWWSRKPHTKKQGFFMICGQQPSWMSTSKPETNHIRRFAMQQFVEYDSSIVLLSHLTPAILLFMFFLNCGRAPLYVFKNGEGGHLGNCALVELGDIFKKGIGAHFSLKCFR